MDIHRTTIHVRVHPEVRETLERVTVNLVQVKRLLAENVELLTESLQRSLEVVEASLDGAEVVSADGDRETA